MPTMGPPIGDAISLYLTHTWPGEVALFGGKPLSKGACRGRHKVYVSQQIFLPESLTWELWKKLCFPLPVV